MYSVAHMGERIKPMTSIVNDKVNVLTAEILITVLRELKPLTALIILYALFDDK